VRAWGMQRDVTREMEALEQAEAASRAKDEFLAMLGHELRNPLSPILTALELMKLRDPSAFARERGVIERQVKHVVRLVDDLLDVSGITRGKVSIEHQEVELADAVASAIELATPMLERAAHHLSVDVPRGLVVRGDPMRLSQVFANLLTNAAKYTPRGGAITVRGEVLNERARISVLDTGIGIRADMLPTIFDLFVQERQPLDRSQGGLGLGLSIVRSLVEMHGGSVEARSEGQGRGSEFAVTLPLAVASPESTIKKSQGPRALEASSFRVLVVDDNEDAAELVSEVLSDSGHTVRVAHDGPSALRALAEFSPDLAVLDIGLPVMDGYELAQRIRSLPEGERIRLVALTGYGQSADRSAAEHAGFDEHLVKPVDALSLERALSKLMTKSAL
jgi:CheY-like chemotaxis protein